MYPQPRGRPRKGCAWNAQRGTWVPIDGDWRPIHKKTPTHRGFAITTMRLSVPTPKVPSPNVQTTVTHEEDTTPTTSAVTDTINIDRPDPERERALCCARTLPTGTPVYYFNEFNVMVELGKEPTRRPIFAKPPAVVPPAPDARPAYRRDRLVKVWGPDESRKLAEGEWEYEDRK